MKSSLRMPSLADPWATRTWRRPLRISMFAAQPEKAVERHVGVERVPEQAGGLEFG